MKNLIDKIGPALYISKEDEGWEYSCRFSDPENETLFAMYFDKDKGNNVYWSDFGKDLRFLLVFNKIHIVHAIKYDY